jgi:hypothetical protein
MKRIIISIVLMLASTHNLFAPNVLPTNTKNKPETVPLELEIHRIQTFIDANKPVAAGTYLPYAQDLLKQIKMYLTGTDVLEYERRLEDMKNTIEIQKDFQKKKYGKLLEVN